MKNRLSLRLIEQFDAVAQDVSRRARPGIYDDAIWFVKHFRNARRFRFEYHVYAGMRIERIDVCYGSRQNATL